MKNQGVKMRDHKKLEVFHFADQYVLDVYESTKNFPREETYGLLSQRRRSAYSVPSNIVEGCGRQTVKEFTQFLSIAFGSLRESLYFVELSGRLGYLSQEAVKKLLTTGNRCAGALSNMIYKIKTN